MEQTMRRPEVNVIPATVRSVENGGQIKKQKSLRVAAYCRVSTGDESQQTSYKTQKNFYTQMITAKPGWTLAGIYADEAISGTSRANRKEFNEMINDALAGKIDYIVTKSISRFARNTIDTLDCVRQLRQLNPPVGIYFEKENIDTLDATGELILTILSALAQDESRSISDNIRWAIQRKFQNGEAMVDLKRMLGYDKGENGEWLINPQQAEIVRYIFDRFVCGASSNAIAGELNAMGKRTVKGCIWRSDSVLYILRNEKYVGDCENQKYFTKNFLTHKAVVNNGEAARYYVSNHHAAIIDRPTWNKVQTMLLERGSKSSDKSAEPKKRRGSRAAVFTNLICGEQHNGKPCGEKLFRVGYNNKLKDYTDSRSLAAEGLSAADYTEHYYYYYPVWRCAKNAQGKKNTGTSCTSGSIYECALEQSFMELLYALKRDVEANGEESWLKRQFREKCERLERRSGRTSFPARRLDTVDMQIHELEEKLNKTVSLSQSSAASYEQPAEDLRCRIRELTKERDWLEAEQGAAVSLSKNFDLFVRCLKELPEINFAGMKINVNGIDVHGSSLKLADAPDYLNFEKGIYMAFVKSGVVRGDVVEYQTNFGLALITTGNSRNLSSFLGFRRANPDKTLTFLDEKWKVSGRSVCYTRKKLENKVP